MSRRITFITAALGADTDDCIIWPFAVRKSSGYGAYCEGSGKNKKNYDIHRFICEKVHGNPKIGEEASHRCGNKLCINPKHLYWNTHMGNMADAIRHGTLRGGGSGRQRIFAGDRAAIKASNDSLIVLGQRYGMEPSYIGKLKRMPPQYDL